MANDFDDLIDRLNCSVIGIGLTADTEAERREEYETDVLDLLHSITAFLKNLEARVQHLETPRE